MTLALAAPGVSAAGPVCAEAIDMAPNSEAATRSGSANLDFMETSRSFFKIQSEVKLAREFCVPSTCRPQNQQTHFLSKNFFIIAHAHPCGSASLAITITMTRLLHGRNSSNTATGRACRKSPQVRPKELPFLLQQRMTWPRIQRWNRGIQKCNG